MNEAQTTLDLLERCIASATEQGADLLVLPECAYPAYLLGSVTSYRAGDHLSSRAFVSWLQEQAARHRVHLVCGFVEDTADALHNTAILIDDKGNELGRPRKRFLWNADYHWFAPGNEIQAFDSRLGRIGIIICAEARIPEIVATLVADGAECIAMPTCWINATRTSGQYENPQVSFMIEARAREFGIPFVCADKSGLETAGVGYVGMSRIVRADGSLAAEAPPDGDAVITANIVLQRPPRLSITDTQRSRLFSSEPPVRPSVDAPAIKLAVVPTTLAKELLTASQAETFLDSLSRRGVNILVTHIEQADQAAQLAKFAEPFGIHVIERPNEQSVSSLGPMRIGCVTGQEASSFAASRVLALEGAQVLMVFDMIDDLAILRTRAVENRVFVAGVNEGSAIIVDPEGSILAQTNEDDLQEIVAEINLAETADKCVAPGTDVFAGRRVEQYRF